MNDFSDNHFAQTMTAIELPKSSIVNSYDVDKPMSLNSDNEWKPFNLNASLNLMETKTVLFLITYNIRVDNSQFSARLVLENKIKKKSVTSVEGLKFASSQAYVAKVLKKGHYSIDIQFNSNSSNTFSPDLRSDSEKSHVKLHVIELE